MKEFTIVVLLGFSTLAFAKDNSERDHWSLGELVEKFGPESKIVPSSDSDSSSCPTNNPDHGLMVSYINGHQIIELGRYKCGPGGHYVPPNYEEHR